MADSIFLDNQRTTPTDPRVREAMLCATEHKCVLEAVAHLSRSGYRFDVLPVDQDGLVDLAML
jgi:cysteine sulfinate desulfinase/cysteine desulfurase-like protein